jgi:hypothetical protein
MRWQIVTPAVILVGSMVSGCGSSASNGDGGGPSNGGSCQTSSSDPCIQCEFSQCCSEFTACQDDAQCANLANCVQQCGSQTCANQCASTYPSGVSTFNAFGDCLRSQCSNCGSGSGGGSSNSSPSVSATCQAGATNVYECCLLAGASCDSLAQYEQCCGDSSCQVSAGIACMANRAANSINACATSFAACGL